jgi:hypothetical protein
MLELLACGAPECAGKDHIALWRFVEFPVRGDHVAPTGADIVEKDDRPFDFDSDTIDGLEMARVSRATFVRFFLSLGEDKGRDSAEIAAALDLDGLR